MQIALYEKLLKHYSTKNTLGVKKEQPRTKRKKKGLDKKEMRSKWAAKGQCSVSADRNKILIITIQAAKHQAVDVLRPEL